MDNSFPDAEKLYRAVYPPEQRDMFWKADGSVSSAAFADPRGLSVERGNFRTDDAVIEDMKTQFTGRIISVNAKQCREVQAVVQYCPTKRSRYHSEIHGSVENKLLTKSQRRKLAQSAKIEFMG